MAWWKSTKRQRGSVKAHEAKGIGHYGRRAEDRALIAEGLEDLDDEVDHTMQSE